VSGEDEVSMRFENTKNITLERGAPIGIDDPDLPEMTYESERSSIFSENVTKEQAKNVYFREEKDNGMKRALDEEAILPRSRGRAQTFLELNLRMSSLQEIPQSLLQKNQFIRSVDLRNNMIRAIPEQISELSILWKLRLDYN